MWQSETGPNQGIPNQVPWLGLFLLLQIYFCGYSLNTLKYPKMGIRYFFPVKVGFQEMEHAFPFGIFRPEKRITLSDVPLFPEIFRLIGENSHVPL